MLDIALMKCKLTKIALISQLVSVLILKAMVKIIH